MNYIEKDYNRLYYKILYNKRIFDSLSKEELSKIENSIYKSIDEKKKIECELKYLSNLDEKYDKAYLKLYRHILELINKEKEKENPDYNEIKRLISILQIMFNEDLGFYNAFLSIDKAYFYNLTKSI